MKKRDDNMMPSSRLRRLGPAVRYPRCRAQARRVAASLDFGPRRMLKPGHTGLHYVAVSRSSRLFMRIHCRTTRCVFHALPPQRPFVDEHVRSSMKGNKGKDTKPEVLVRRRLREAGLAGYRLQWKAPGRPDIAWPGKRVCILVNGCFWHRCPHCKPPMPKSNQEYWVPKFQRNVERDERNQRALAEAGWRVHVIWECELKKNAIDDTFAALIPLLREELGR